MAPSFGRHMGSDKERQTTSGVKRQYSSWTVP
jgi:hypothetical protein